LSSEKISVNLASGFRVALAACLVAVFSYLAARLGDAFVLRPQMIWPLWPGNAFLVAVLLLSPRRNWAAFLTAGLVGFALSDLQSGLPVRSIIVYFLADAVEILVAVLGVSYAFGGVPRLNSVQSFAKYSLFAVLLAPISVASLAASALGGSYRVAWKVAFLTEALALLTLTPAILSWADILLARRQTPRARYVEATVMLVGLLVLAYFAFTLPWGWSRPALLYALVPFLLWSVLRFGMAGISNSMIVVAVFSIWGAIHGRGPFTGSSAVNNVLSLQLFLLFATSSFMVLAVLVDEQEEAREQLRESEGRFRLVANTAPVMIWMSGLDKKPTYFNQLWMDFTGLSETDLQNGLAEIIHPEDYLQCHEVYCRGFDQRQPFRKECRLRRHDGQYRWILDIGVPRFHKDGSFAGYIGSCIDVTESKQAEEARIRTAAIVESSDDAIIGLDVNGTITDWNKGAERLFGYSASEAIGQNVLFLSAADYRDDTERLLKKVWHGEIVKRHETVRRRKDGTSVDISLTISPIVDPQGRISGASGISRDITDRRRAEEALRESEEKFRSVFREAGVGMIVVSPEGRFLAANRTFCDCLGYTEEELLSKTVEAVTLPEDWPAFAQKLQDVLTQERGFQWFQKRCLHKSGRIVYTENSASVIRSREGKLQYLVGQALDITKRKEAEEALSAMTRKLVEAQEQERTRIARELHDDINQRLAMLAVELGQIRENHPELPSEVLSAVLELRRQTTEISDDVQALSHDLHSSQLEYLGLVAGMKSWCGEFGERHRMQIDYRHDVGSSLPPEIGLCLLRILQEALHNAAKHSGVKQIEVQLREEPDEIHLIIHDSGRGFDVEGVKQGKGLGLISMRERVRLVDGTIAIDSKPMGGTTIHARVPIRSEQEARRAS
jgi:PAS domain S-box-containing protein